MYKQDRTQAIGLGCALFSMLSFVMTIGVFFVLMFSLSLWARIPQVSAPLMPVHVAIAHTDTPVPTLEIVALTEMVAPTPIPLPTHTPGLATGVPLPTDTPTRGPTALPVMAEYNSGGLGQPLEWWVSKFGEGVQGVVGATVYGVYAVRFSSGNANYIEHQLVGVSDPDAVLAEARSLMPVDSQLVNTYSPEGRPETTVLLHMSESLKARFDEGSFVGGEPGNFTIQFKTFEEGIPVLIIATGNNP